jgi:Cu-processing system permease protein
MATVVALAQREISDALKNRWFIVYSGAFVVLSVALAMMVVNSAGYAGISGFGRTAAGLINLVLFLAPLMGLTLGAQAISSEREQGTMTYLLAQPISMLELFVAKFIGLALAIGAAIIFGFALSTLTISYLSGGEGIDVFLRLTVLTVLLAWVSLALGYLISGFTRRTSTALGIAIVVWLFLVLIGDLGLMGTSVVLDIDPDTLLSLALVNPLEVFRIAAITLLRDSMELLGPSGLVARKWFGDAVTIVLTSILAAWLAATLMLAYWVTKREEQK